MGLRDVRRGVSPEEDQKRYLLVEAGLDLTFLEKGQENIHPKRLVGECA
jgi:hypothetical protein